MIDATPEPAQSRRLPETRCPRVAPRLLLQWCPPSGGQPGGLMQTVVIPRADWRAKLDEFSTVHQGWRVSLELLEPSLGAQPEIDDLPLRGVTAEVDVREPAI